MKEAPSKFMMLSRMCKRNLLRSEYGEGEEKLVKISKSLYEEERRKPITLLREYKDVFAWSY